MMRDRSVSFSKIMELRKSERAQLHRPRGAYKNLLQKSTATPTFPQDFSADVTDFLIVPQGDYYTFESSGGFEYWCLKTNSNGKIQTEFQKAPNYVSYSTNQTRLGDPGASQAVIQDYNLGKEFKVDSNNTCQSY